MERPEAAPKPPAVASGPGSRRRIAVLFPSLVEGGVERVSLLAASGLVDRGYEIDLLIRDLDRGFPDAIPPRARTFFFRTTGRRGDQPSPPGHTAPELLSSGSRFPRLALAPVLSRKQLVNVAHNKILSGWAAATASYLDRERPDALLAMDTRAVCAGTMAACLASRRPRIVAGLHGVLKRLQDVWMARASYVYADAAFGVSSGVAAELRRLPGMARERVHTVYNPVVTGDMDRMAREPVYHPWIGGAGPPVILAVGRLSVEKDFSTLLAAFARLLAWRPARLIVLGEGKRRPHLLSLARRLGVAEHVDFPGFVDNPYAFMAQASLFVLSSRREGLSTVLIEAMACGCPVVSTDCSYGPREILEDGKRGPLVPVGDAEALAAAMARTLDAPPRPEALRERASFFDAARAIDRYEELLLGQA